jgi:hypothetical protein
MTFLTIRHTATFSHHLNVYTHTNTQTTLLYNGHEMRNKGKLMHDFILFYMCCMISLVYYTA